ncbi:MAG: hypothetical protein MZW92_73790 [Comamonadaceae bacterium]|nr:hypothetical protein [Comamonadaceae bacterium]
MSRNPAEFPRATLEQWAQAAAKSAPGGDVAALNWVTPEGIARQAALHGGRHRAACRTPTRCPASSRSCAARRPRCTRCGRGRSASTPASPPPRTPTRFYRAGAGRRRAGRQRGLRPGHAPRLRQRPPARHRRRRQGRRGDRLASRT